MARLCEDGCLTFEANAHSLAWAQQARAVGQRIAADPDMRSANLRHGNTWFVGVDALPTKSDGSLGTAPLKGPWDPHLPLKSNLHAAQLSIIYPGYPQRDHDQSEANHQFRIKREAAHVDGLLPCGPERRRYACEFHAYVLGIGLSNCSAAPTVYWKGSHHIVARALRAALEGRQPKEVDLTEVYHAARKQALETCPRVELPCRFGASFLLHRFAVHGTAIWGDVPPRAGGRPVAFFRPEYRDFKDWLSAD